MNGHHPGAGVEHEQLELIAVPPHTVRDRGEVPFGVQPGVVGVGRERVDSDSVPAAEQAEDVSAVVVRGMRINTPRYL